MKIIQSSHWALLGALFLAASAMAQTPQTLSDADRAEIQQLMGKYAQALFGCHAEEFADLFVPGTGSFTSGFRGRMVGHEHLMGLVESERHCTAPPDTPKAPRPGGNDGPNVELHVMADGVHGVANLGTAEYQDVYAKTSKGWRFASRTVVVANEKAAGVEAADMLAINRLDGDKLGDHYEQRDGAMRLMTSGVRIGVKDGQVTGRAFLKDGGYNDETYEKLGPGKWRVKSSTYVPPESH